MEKNADENFQIIRKLVEDVGNLFENANQSMVPKSHNNRYDDDEIRVRLQDMDKVSDTNSVFQSKHNRLFLFKCFSYVSIGSSNIEAICSGLEHGRRRREAAMLCTNNK